MDEIESPIKPLHVYYAFTIRQKAWPFWESWYFSLDKNPTFPKGYELKDRLGAATTDGQGQFVRMECPNPSDIVHINNPGYAKPATLADLEVDRDTWRAWAERYERDRDYWQTLAMQFHDAVHAEVDRRNAEIERRSKVEI